MAASDPTTADFLLEVQTAAAAFVLDTAPEAPATDFLLQLQTAAAAFAQDFNARLTAVEEANQKLQEEKEVLNLRFITAQEEHVKALTRINAQIKARDEAFQAMLAREAQEIEVYAKGLMLAHKAQKLEYEFGGM